MVGGTHQDLTACFVWKQVRLEFPSLVSRLVEARRGWCMCHHHECCIELKMMMDRVDVIGCVEPFYLNFSVFYVLGPSGILVFCLGV
jgi:hypothetical protein